MSILKTIFRVFKGSALYDSYTDNQRNAVNKICEMYLNNDVPLNEQEVIKQLEMKVSRRVLSASIPVRKINKLLGQRQIGAGDLELVNLFEDVEDQSELTLLVNQVVEYCNENNATDMHQIIYFPEFAEQYLTDMNLKRLHKLQLNYKT